MQDAAQPSSGQDAAAPALVPPIETPPVAAPAAGGTAAPALRESRFLLLLFLLSLLVQLAYAYQIRDLPTQHELVMDARFYDQLARQIVEHRWRLGGAFQQAPLYPYFLAAVYSLAAALGGIGPAAGIAAARLLQALMGAAVPVLLAVGARRMFGVVAGRATGLMAAFYGPAVFYGPLLLKQTPLLVLESCLLLLLVPPVAEAGAAAANDVRAGAAGGVRPLRAAVAGAVLGGAALLLENLLLLGVIAALFLLWSEGGESATASRQGRWLSAGALVAGIALAVAPLILLGPHGGERGGGVMSTSALRGGMNFFIGNSRFATGTFMPFTAGSQDPERQWEDAVRLAAAIESRRVGREVRPESLSRAQVSAILGREALREIGDDPAAWVRLLVRKSRLFWNGYEIPDSEGYAVYRRESPVLRLAALDFGIVAPLAMLGLLLALWPGERSERRRAELRGAILLALLAAGCWLAAALLFVLARYRLPVVPFLLPLAGNAVSHARQLPELWRRRAWAPLAGAALALAAAAAVVNVPIFTPAERRRHDASIYYNLGDAATRWSEERYRGFLGALRSAGGAVTPDARERFDQAVAGASRGAAYLDRAIADDPRLFPAQILRAVAVQRRGSYLAGAGNTAEALAAYAEARRELVTALGSGSAKEIPEVAERGRTVLAALDGQTAAALNNLAARSIESGQLGRAETLLERAAALAPRLPGPRGNLALCWLQGGLRARRSGDEEAAQRLFQASRDAYAAAGALAAAAGLGGQQALYRHGREMAQAELARGLRPRPP
ncbi:MAG TPA: hypothetical protein VHR45_02990 [Thermoanaerobaculia bacterium]|nr:hypothetical protein [Thermoanaerobaculia bacterium]